MYKSVSGYLSFSVFVSSIGSIEAEFLTFFKEKIAFSLLGLINIPNRLISVRLKIPGFHTGHRFENERIDQTIVPVIQCLKWTHPETSKTFEGCPQ